MIIARTVMLLILSGGLFACGQAEQSREEEPVEKLAAAQDINELGLELRRMVKTPSADRPEQCKIVEMGHKPCGGPERYLLYSQKTMTGDEEAAFLEKLRQYNELSRLRMEKSGMVSDCQVLPKPTTVVRKGFCVPAEKNTM